MGIADTNRVSAARAQQAPGRVASLNRHSPLRPYTRFTRGGIYCIRPPEPGPKLFRVA